MSSKKSKESLEKRTISIVRAREIIDKAVKNGFHQATNEQLLGEARSIRHLRSLIGYYQRKDQEDKKDVMNDAPYVATFGR
jgi:hypothetical protein